MFRFVLILLLSGGALFPAGIGKVFKVLNERKIEVAISVPGALKVGQILYFYRGGKLVGNGAVVQLFHSKVIARVISGKAQKEDQVALKKMVAKESPHIEAPIAFNHVESTDEHLCAVLDSRLGCWGDPSGNKTDIPVVKKPIQVAVSKNGACVLDPSGIHCWGDLGYDDPPPKLRNPRSVVAGGYHYCALDDDGVKCWGANQYGQAQVPDLNRPKKVTAGSLHTCALDLDGVTCWGLSVEALLEVPDLRTPTNLWSGRGSNCAADATGIVCWGYGGSGDLLKIPELKNVKHVSFGLTHACALADAKVICWGDNKYNQTTVPELVNPVYVVAGFNLSCAIDEKGVVCWGSYNSGGVFEVPSGMRR